MTAMTPMPPEDPNPTRMLATALLCLLGWVAAVLLVMMLGGCAPKVVIVTPIAPAAAKVHAAAAAQATAAKRVTGGLVDIGQQTGDLRATLAAGMLEADRLRKTGLASQSDLDANSARWQAAATRAAELAATASAATLSGRDLEAAAAALDLQAGDLERAAITQDAGVENLKTEIVASADNAALGKQLKRTVWIALVLLVLGAIAFLVLRFGPSILNAASALRPPP